MRRLFLVVLMVAAIGCAFTATKEDVSLKSTPNSASYDIDLGVVASSGVVEIPFGEKVAKWISGAIEEVKGLLDEADPNADSGDS